MKIDFIASNQNLEVGSYRIWVDGVSRVLCNKKHDIKIIKSIDQIRPDAVVIFSKGDYQYSDQIKGDVVKGAINISADEKKGNFDFLICGSIEEKKSLEKNHKNVVIVNLIEDLYSNLPLKIHKKKDEIVVGFHGSYTHLFKMKFGFIDAFNELVESGSNVILKIITDNVDMALKFLTESGVRKDRLIVQKWNINTVIEDLRDIDIGVVPNATNFERVDPEVLRICSNDAGIYSTDYFLRFKNKSNPGRAFVFIQNGIPVISDLTPSNMPLFHDEKCGQIANCKMTWKAALERFFDEEVRRSVARLASERFKSMYSFEKDIDELERVIQLCVNRKIKN